MSCWIKRHDLTDSLCDGRMDPAHFISQMKLKQAGDYEYLDDERNIRTICRRHHHQLDQGFIKLRYGDYPRSVHEFAFDLNYAYTERGWRKQALVP